MVTYNDKNIIYGNCKQIVNYSVLKIKNNAMFKITTFLHPQYLLPFITIFTAVTALPVSASETNVIISKKDWILFTHLMIDHGRKICIANRPKCDICILRNHCPSAHK